MQTNTRELLRGHCELRGLPVLGMRARSRRASTAAVGIHCADGVMIPALSRGLEVAWMWRARRVQLVQVRVDVWCGVAEVAEVVIGGCTGVRSTRTRRLHAMSTRIANDRSPTK